MEMSCVLYEEGCSQKEAEMATEALKKKIKKLQWEKRHYELKDDIDYIQVVEGDLAYNSALLAFYEKKMIYPLLEAKQLTVLYRYFFVRYAIPGAEIFSREALNLIPDQVRDAYERAFMSGLFTSFTIGHHWSTNENILIGYRGEMGIGNMFLIARWGRQTFGSWDDIVECFLMMQDRRKAAPLAVPLVLGGGIGICVFIGTNALFVPLSVAWGVWWLGMLGGWGAGLLWHFYGRKRYLAKAITSPFE